MEIQEEYLFKLIERLELKKINEKIQIVDTDLDYDKYDEENGYKVFHSEGYLFDVVKNKNYSDENQEKFEWNYNFEDTAYDGFKNCTLKKAIKLVEKELLLNKN